MDTILLFNFHISIQFYNMPEKILFLKRLSSKITQFSSFINLIHFPFYHTPSFFSPLGNIIQPFSNLFITTFIKFIIQDIYMINVNLYY